MLSGASRAWAYGKIAMVKLPEGGRQRDSRLGTHLHGSKNRRYPRVRATHVARRIEPIPRWDCSFSPRREISLRILRALGSRRFRMP
jgi:hypothetical protein